MSRKILYVDASKCTGCRMCEVACSYFHEDEFNPALSRIQIVGVKRDCLYFPIVCEQCEKPFCEAVCPAGAIRQDLETGSWNIDEDKCIGCKSCLNACPLGAVGFNATKKVSIKCDLCDGEPQCVKVCPMDVIEFVDEQKIGMKRKWKAAEKIFEAERLKEESRM